MDRRLRAAAVKINRAIGTTTIVVDEATSDAVRAADPQTVAAAIPAGLPPRLLDRVLTVYSALATRSAAMSYFRGAGTWPRTHSPEPWAYDEDRAVPCLSNGTAAAAHFDTYVADLRTLARSLPSRPAAAPSSRAAAELAAIVAWVDLTYNGCSNCGGPVITRAPTIDWGAAPGTAPTAHGWVGGIEFTATYTAADGWQAGLQAC